MGEAVIEDSLHGLELSHDISVERRFQTETIFVQAIAHLKQ